MNKDMLWMPPVAALLVLLVSLAGIAGFFTAQYGFGLMPCELCLWQRLPYYASAALALAIVLGGRQTGIAPVGFVLLALVWLTSFGLAVFHSGVERHWWLFGGACSSGAGGALTPETLRAQLLATPVKRCDEIDWTLLGLSMANWNVLLSAGVAVYVGIVSGKIIREK